MGTRMGTRRTHAPRVTGRACPKQQRTRTPKSPKGPERGVWSAQLLNSSASPAHPARGGSSPFATEASWSRKPSGIRRTQSSQTLSGPSRFATFSHRKRTSVPAHCEVPRTAISAETKCSEILIARATNISRKSALNVAERTTLLLLSSGWEVHNRGCHAPRRPLRHCLPAFPGGPVITK